MTEFLHLLQDPAHWAFEFVGEFVTFLLAIPIARISIRRHDRKKHAT